MIGIFDSGVGGMTVARAIERMYPGFPFVYFGDLAHMPYGSKSRDMLLDYSKRNTDFLLDQGAKIIVIACNTASSAAACDLRAQYDLPIIDVITPAVRKAAQLSENGRIGMIGTRATVQSGVYKEKLAAIRPECNFYSQACPLLVPLVEEGWLIQRETKMIVRKYLRPLREKQIDTLILGCTHYPLLKKIIIPRIGKRVNIIDSSVTAADALQSLLDRDNRLKEELFAPDTESKFYVSDLSSPVESLAASIFGRSIHLEKTYV